MRLLFRRKNQKAGLDRYMSCLMKGNLFEIAFLNAKYNVVDVSDGYFGDQDLDKYFEYDQVALVDQYEMEFIRDRLLYHIEVK